MPTNKLHEQGYVSIGCEPCTKAVLPNQHEREGRWWWEVMLHASHRCSLSLLLTMNVLQYKLYSRCTCLLHIRTCRYVPANISTIKRSIKFHSKSCIACSSDKSASQKRMSKPGSQASRYLSNRKVDVPVKEGVCTSA